MSIEVKFNDRVQVPTRKISGRYPCDGYVLAIRQYVWQREPRYYIRTVDGHRAWYRRHQFRPMNTRVRRVAWSEINRLRGLDDEGIPLDPVARARFVESEGNGQYQSHLVGEEREYFLSLLDADFCMSRENREKWRAYIQPRNKQRELENYEGP